MPTASPAPTVSPQPTTSSLPSPLPTASPRPSASPTPVACFDLSLRDNFGDGWDGATFRISSVGPTGPNIVAAGPRVPNMEDIDDFEFFEETFNICLPANACYAMQTTTGSFDEENAWDLGNGALLGLTPTQNDALFFLALLDDDEKDPGSHSRSRVTPGCTTSSPTTSSAPTASPPSRLPRDRASTFASQASLTPTTFLARPTPFSRPTTDFQDRRRHGR